MHTSSEPPVPAPSARAELVLFGLTALWGMTFPATKGALEDIDPVTLMCARFVLGVGVTGALAGRGLMDGPSIRAGLLIAPVFVGSFALQTLGLLYTTPSRSAFLTAVSLPLVPLIGWIGWRAAPSRWAVTGILIGLVGIWRITGVSEAPSPSETMLGDALTLGSAVLFGLHIVLVGRFARGRNASTLAAMQLGVGALAMGLCLPILSAYAVIAPSASLNPSSVWAIVFLGVFASGLSLLWQTWGQARTASVRAAVIYTLEPLFATAFSVVLGYETVSSVDFVGGAIIVVGVLVGELGGPIARRLGAAPVP